MRLLVINIPSATRSSSQIIEYWKTELAHVVQDNRDVITLDDVSFSFIEDIAGFVKRDTRVELNALMDIIHHPSLASLQAAICTEIQSVYTKKGTLLVTPSMIKDGVYTNWSDEVNAWEDVISDRLRGQSSIVLWLKITVRRPRVLSVHIGYPFTKSFPIQRKISSSPISRNLRVEWSALQKEKSLGVQGLEKEDKRLVEYLEAFFALIAALDFDGGELSTRLCIDEWSVPIDLKRTVLELYLERSDAKPSQMMC